jgi:hypothetical protein
MRLHGIYRKTPDLQKDLDQIVAWINGETSPVAMTVAVAGTEVAVAHGLGFIPSSAAQVVKETPTGTGVVYPGTTAWTNRLAYLTATVAGDYAVTFRR